MLQLRLEVASRHFFIDRVPKCFAEDSYGNCHVATPREGRLAREKVHSKSLEKIMTRESADRKISRALERAANRFVFQSELLSRLLSSGEV